MKEAAGTAPPSGPPPEGGAEGGEGGGDGGGGGEGGTCGFVRGPEPPPFACLPPPELPAALTIELPIPLTTA